MTLRDLIGPGLTLVLAFFSAAAGAVFGWRRYEKQRDAELNAIKEQFRKELAQRDNTIETVQALLRKHDQTLYGEDGRNGHKKRIGDLEVYIHGNPGQKDLETRTRHGAANSVMRTIMKDVNRIDSHIIAVDRRLNALERER